jgi:peptide/nickel transport system substrate-binding protein
MKKSKSVLLWYSVLSLSVSVLFSATLALAQKEGGQIRYPLTAEPRPIDGQQWFNEKMSNVVGQHIYESLIAVDKNLNFIPALATSWKMAPDYRSCVFTLRKGVNFHDGTPFDAKAVEANFNRIVTDHPNCWKVVEGWFKSTEVIDEYTVKINLSRPYTPFLTEMLQAYARIISPLAIKQYGMKLGQTPSGTGPWKFVEWIPGDRILLERNASYWKGKPRLDGIVFKFTPDITTRMMGFESVSFDLLDQPQYTDIERLLKTKRYDSHSQPSSEMFHLVFNCVSEPFDQKKVRQAIAYGINKDLIVQSLLGENVIVANGFGPVYLKETLIKKEQYPYNPGKAKELLKSLGWNPGPDGTLVKDGKRLQFKVLTPAGRYPMDRQIAEAVQANLKQIGIDVAIEVVDSAAFIKWMQAPKDELKASGIGLLVRTRPLGGSLDWAFTQHYHSQQTPPAGSNSGYYSNRELDEYLAKGPTLINDKERQEVYRKAQETLFEDLPVIPIYYYRNFMFNQANVKTIDLFTPLCTPAPFVSHETWMDK